MNLFETRIDQKRMLDEKKQTEMFAWVQRSNCIADNS